MYPEGKRGEDIVSVFSLCSHEIVRQPRMIILVK